MLCAAWGSLAVDDKGLSHAQRFGVFDVVPAHQLLDGHVVAGGDAAQNIAAFYLVGNLGAFGDADIYPETNICVLSDNTIELLSLGTKDETIKYIEDYYNNRNSITFDFSFLSESTILDYCRRRCEWCGDEITMSLYIKYLQSAHKNS